MDGNKNNNTNSKITEESHNKITNHDIDKDDVNLKFSKILATYQKSKKLDEFSLIKGNNHNLFNQILNILEEKIKVSCFEHYEKLLAFSKRKDNMQNSLEPVTGYEKEFKLKEQEFMTCVGRFDDYKNSLDNDLYLMKRFSSESYDLCLESCKDEMINKNLNEMIVRNCLNSCHRFLLMNKEILNGILNERLLDLNKEFASFNI